MNWSRDNFVHTEDAPPDTADMDYVVRFCHGAGIWAVTSRNHSGRVDSLDPATTRRRLGKKGIPPHDELRTYLASYRTKDGELTYFAVHYRGSHSIDLEKVKECLSIRSAVTRISGENGGGEDGVGRELVNPFNLVAGFQGKTVVQVFDKAVLEPVGLPGTMMTNAGSRASGIEFRPEELFKALGHLAIMADVTFPPPALPPRRTAIGIITGNAPNSGMLLWQHVNSRVQERLGEHFLGDLSYPPVTIRSVPALGLSMEIKRRSGLVWEHLRDAIRDLCDRKVGLIALACHTNHYFTDRIRQEIEGIGPKFISMAEVVEDWVRESFISELTLVGIDTVADLGGGWSAYSRLGRHAKVIPISPKGLDRIHELGYQVKQEGPTEAGRRRLRSILLDEARTAHVVIALTEISILLASQRRKKQTGQIITDALKLYGDEIADAYLKLAHPSGL